MAWSSLPNFKITLAWYKICLLSKPSEQLSVQSKSSAVLGRSNTLKKWAVGWTLPWMLMLRLSEQMLPHCDLLRQQFCATCCTVLFRCCMYAMRWRLSQWRLLVWCQLQAITELSIWKIRNEKSNDDQLCLTFLRTLLTWCFILIQIREFVMQKIFTIISSQVTYFLYQFSSVFYHWLKLARLILKSIRILEKLLL
jgi:hypothetical protein